MKQERVERVAKRTSVATKHLVFCAMFVALMIVGAFVKIPTPLLPVTLQVAFCVACALMLGAKLATISMATYVIMGLVGIPVFTAGGGIAYVLKPSFGYLFGFIAGAFLTGILCDHLKRKNQFTFWRALPCAIAAMLTIHIIGATYLYFIMNLVVKTPITLWQAAMTGSIMFLPSDTLWCIIGCICAVKITPVLDKIIK